jgi:hypothetical protein
VRKVLEIDDLWGFFWREKLVGGKNCLNFEEERLVEGEIGELWVAKNGDKNNAIVGYKISWR